ncbi:ATP-grasp fold amidoligase family protein [Ruania zhangjianzhongii]|uniref:ATP-grasp fold amidoligase family protein n=1 Tax=Ruania zhangjianzhongii TaxID=2603206 RepID=UPI0011C971CB|nr:ATP-grasp fold amidoligase family protein [Ruania zhangjianzhongii]
MAQALRKFIERHFGPIRRRDEKITTQKKLLKRSRRQVVQLRRRLRAAEAELSRLHSEKMALVSGQENADAQEKKREELPSFRREILSHRALVRQARFIDPESKTALRQIPHKLRTYTLAESHGLRTPEILGLWPDIDSIDFTGLPEAFVLKSDGGAGGQGIFPLIRTSENRFTIAGSTNEVTQQEVKDTIRSLRPGKARPPFFVEKFITSKNQQDPIPQDIKIYAFYGEIGQILLRSVSQHGSHHGTRYRFIWPDGSDLGEVSFDTAAPAIDANVPIPDNLDKLVEVARHLSLCVGTSFIRVDVYDTSGAPTIGELTRVPGGQHRYRTEHDQVMGAMWLRARARLEYDLTAGRPPGAIHGEHSAVDYYQQLGTVQTGPGSWPTIHRPCSQWCQRPLA